MATSRRGGIAIQIAVGRRPGGPMAAAADNARSRLAAMQAKEKQEGPEPGEPSAQVPKGQANYRPSTDPTQMCATCENYDGESVCVVVAGNIEPHMVSDYWEPKTQNGDQNESNPPNLNSMGESVPPPSGGVGVPTGT